MSDFLNDVMNCPIKANLVGNHAMCSLQMDGREVHFLATDENDWYGTLMVQFQEKLSGEQAGRLRRFIGSLKHLPLPNLFRFECHDLTGEVRAVIRWPLHAEYFGLDDVKQAIGLLSTRWLTVEPFLRRVSKGEDANQMADAVNARLAILNPQIISAATLSQQVKEKSK